MRIDGDRINKRLEAKRGKAIRVTVYLDEDVYKGFKKRCGKLSVSSVVQELMNEYIKSFSKQK